MRKRWIWMMTLLLPLTALAWAAFPHPCAACSCAAVTPLQAAEQAAAVFEGKVLGIRETYDPYDESGAIGRRYAVRLEVDSIRKGELPSEAIVYTGFHSCGIDFKQGETYLVYAQERHPGELETHLCAGTKALTDARDDLALLPVGVKPSTQADLSGSLMTEVPGWLALYAKQAWNKLTQPHALAKLGLLALGFAIACAFVATKRKRLPLYSLFARYRLVRRSVQLGPVGQPHLAESLRAAFQSRRMAGGAAVRSRSCTARHRLLRSAAAMGNAGGSAVGRPAKLICGGDAWSLSLGRRRASALYAGLADDEAAQGLVSALMQCPAAVGGAGSRKDRAGKISISR